MTIKDEPDVKQTESEESDLDQKISDQAIKLEETQRVDDTEADKMITAGVHFGHKTNKKHPKMEPYIHGVRNGVNIIDIQKTEEKLEESLKYIEDLISKGGVLMVVGTKIQLTGPAKLFAEECELPYIIERWLGGTFTNFENIKKRVDYLKDLEKKKEEGELEKYTKKEQLDMSREITILKNKFEGLKPLSKLPDAVLILDMDKDDLAVKEARMKDIKIIAITDTNVNPELVNYPIPANDDAISSVTYILDRIKERILKAKAGVQKRQAE